MAGIDLCYAPPKEVSALWATTDPYRRAQIEVAHRKAVKSTVQRIEKEVAVVRRKTDEVTDLKRQKGCSPQRSFTRPAAREGPGRCTGSPTRNCTPTS